MADSNETIIFTDGACSGNPGPGGWGAIVLSPDGLVRELGGADQDTTNNRMELMAAMAALEILVDPEIGARIYTDSSYVAEGASKWIYGWMKKGWKTSSGGEVKNKDLWEKLKDLIQGKKLKWQVVPGHSGVPGNERCDEIAVAFSEGRNIDLYEGRQSDYGIDLSVISGDGTKTKKSKSSKKPLYYLSYVGNSVHRDKTWKECEARVKGQAAAKYQKVFSESEEAALLKKWGV